MGGLWRLLFCIALLALTVHCEEDEADVADNDNEHETGHESYGPVDDSGDDDEDQQDKLEPARAKALFIKIDKNNDGKISLAEILAFSQTTKLEQAVKQVDEHMEMMDEDKDGKVSLSEMAPTGAPDEDASEESKANQKAFQDLEEMKFKQADKNHDGFLDKTELPTAIYPETDSAILAMMAQHTLKTKDKNGDNELDLKEFWKSETNPIEHDDDEAWQDMKEEMVKLDTDKNGKLNLKEIERWESGDHHTASSMKNFFEVVDENKDDHISHEELDKLVSSVKGGDDASMLFNEWIEHHEL